MTIQEMIERLMCEAYGEVSDVYIWDYYHIIH